MTHQLRRTRALATTSASSLAGVAAFKSTASVRRHGSLTTRAAHGSPHSRPSCLTASMRCVGDFNIEKNRAVHFVTTRPPEFSEDDTATSGEAWTTAMNSADMLESGVLYQDKKSVKQKSTEADAAAPSVVDFTETAAAEAKLDKLYRCSDKSVRFLSQQERAVFTDMIYDKFYKEEGRAAAAVQDPAMRYQASLEVQWVEEWMAGVARTEGLSSYTARRRVKTALLEYVDLEKPLSYIVGSQPFFGCDIHCEAPLLCPRPETEMWTHWLVYNFLHKASKARIGPPAETHGTSPAAALAVLDVCCGTGCIGVAIAKHVPSAVVTALDILPQAVGVSEENARRNGVPATRYTAMQSDMFACFLAETDCGSTRRTRDSAAEAAERPLGSLQTRYAGTFDVIVSNPPYVLPSQYVNLPVGITHWESKLALVGDAYRESRQYLYFKELCVHGAALLKPRRARPAPLRDTPNIVIEVGLQAHMVADLMEKSTLWRDVNVHLDYAQQERWVSATSAH